MTYIVDGDSLACIGRVFEKDGAILKNLYSD